MDSIISVGFLSPQGLSLLDSKLKEQIANLGLEEQLSYRAVDEDSGITKCVLSDYKDKIARGIAILNPSDSKDKVKGRVIARMRALRAYRREKNSEPLDIRDDASPALLEAYNECSFKSEFLIKRS